MGNILWTTEEEKVLQQMCEAHVRLEDMCQVLSSRTRSAIREKCDRNGWAIYYGEPVVDLDALKRVMAERKKYGVNGD